MPSSISGAKSSSRALPPLLRHYLLRSNARAGEKTHLKVPALPNWPTRDRWREHGIEAIHSSGDAFLISASAWQPEWLGSSDDGMFADVRTIIHATIPETLDRYYQEVGRGGRDGQVSVSLLVFDDSDWELPKRLATPIIISNELGFSRWESMWKSRRPTSDDNLWCINIESVREGLSGSSDENVKWNLRTLILMARAGLLALEVEVNRSDQDAEPGEDASSILSAMANIRVRLRNHGHLDECIWENAVVASRHRTLESASRNLALMRELLPNSLQSAQQIGREVGETLGNLYRITSEPWSVQVSRVCGGCPRDRFQVGRQTGYAAPVVVPIPRIDGVLNTTWAETFPWINASFAYVFYDETQPTNKLRHDVLQFARWLVHSCAVQEIGAPFGSVLAQGPEWMGLYQHARDRVLLHRSTEEYARP